MAKKIIPYIDMVLVKKLEEEKNSGSILIPETAKMPMRMECRVLALGKNVKESCPQLKIGSKIILKKNHGHEVTINEIDYLLLPFDDIEALII